MAERAKVMTLLELDFHLTNKCNMRCRHCVFSSGERTIEEMKFSEVTQCIYDFAEITSHKGIINLFGGEVLLRPDIFRIIDVAKSLGLTIGLTTNALVSTALISRLKKLNLSRITVDLDGCSPNTHDWLRNKSGDFKRVIEIIKLLVSLKFYTSVNTVLYKKNIHEVINILELCKNLGVNAIAFYFFTPIGRGRKMVEMMVGPQEWILTKNRIIEWIKQNKPRFDVVWERAYEEVPYKKNPSQYRCGTRHSETIFVRCDGEVYSCALLEGAPCSLGNVKREGLKKILKKRNKFAFNKLIGCPAIAFHVNNNLNGPDPRPSTPLIHPTCPYNYEVLTKGAFVKSIYI
jgi:MoaA/NifB/PqqE/SkfB family radical SAM enzyme